MIMNAANHPINEQDITTTDLFDSKTSLFANTPMTNNISSDPVLAFTSASSSQPMNTSYYHRRQPFSPHTNYPPSRDPFFSSTINNNNNSNPIDTMQNGHSQLSPTSRVFPYQLPPIMLSSTNTGNLQQQSSSSSPHHSSILQISNIASTATTFASHSLHTSGAPITTTATPTCSTTDWSASYATTSSSATSNFPHELNMIPITTKSPYDLHTTTTNRNIPSFTTKPYSKEPETKTSSSRDTAFTTAKEPDTHEWNRSSDMIQASNPVSTMTLFYSL